MTMNSTPFSAYCASKVFFLKRTCGPNRTMSAPSISSVSYTHLYRMSCFQFNIFQRALLNTLTAGDAGFGSRKFLCVDKHRIKQIVDDAAVQFVLYRSRQFRKTFSFFDTLCGLLDDRVSRRKLLLRFLCLLYTSRCV